MRIRPAVRVALVTAILVAGPLAGCSSEDDPSASAGAAPTDSAGKPVPTSPAPARPELHGAYSVRLAVLDGGAGSPYTLEITNTGRRPDHYRLQVVPGDRGQALPEHLALRPGERAVVQIQPDAQADQSAREQGLDVEVHSRGVEAVITSVTLVPPSD